MRGGGTIIRPELSQADVLWVGVSGWRRAIRVILGTSATLNRWKLLVTEGPYKVGPPTLAALEEARPAFFAPPTSIHSCSPLCWSSLCCFLLLLLCTPSCSPCRCRCLAALGLLQAVACAVAYAFAPGPRFLRYLPLLDWVSFVSLRGCINISSACGLEPLIAPSRALVRACQAVGCPRIDKVFNLVCCSSP